MCALQVLAWLLCKHEQCKAALAQGPLVGMDDKSADAYAAAFLSEYLSQSWYVPYVWQTSQHTVKRLHRPVLLCTDFVLAGFR